MKCPTVQNFTQIDQNVHIKKLTFSIKTELVIMKKMILYKNFSEKHQLRAEGDPENA